MSSRIMAMAAFAACLYPLWLLLLAIPVLAPFVEPMLANAFAGVAVLAGCLLVIRWPLARVLAFVAGLWAALCLLAGGPSAAFGFLLAGAAATAIGARLLQRLEVFTAIERAVLAYLCGMAVIIAFLGPLLRLNVHYPTVYSMLLGAICLWQRAALSELAGSQAREWREWRSHRPAPVTVVLALAAVAVWVVGALGTLTPIAAYDDLAGHLRLAYEMLVHHRYSFDVRHQLWAAAPWGADLAFAIPFVVSQGNEGVKAWVAGSYHVASAILLLGMLARRLPIGPALLFVGAYLSTPLILAANHTLHTEGMSAAVVLAVFALWAFQRHAASAGPVICASLLLGLLGATKSSNLVACLFLGLLWLPSMWRQARARAAVGLAIAAGLATVLTPYVTAWLLTGNPVLPLFNAVFKSPYFGPHNFTNPLYTGMFGPQLFAGLFLSGTRHLETALPIAGGLTLFLLLPPATVLLAGRADVERRAALLVALVFSLTLLWSQQYLRYLLPVMGLSVFAASIVWEQPPAMAAASLRLWRGWWAVLLALAIAMGTLTMPHVFWQTELLDMIGSLRTADRHAYLAVNAPERGLNRVVNEDLGVHARVLYGGDPFGADLYGTPIYRNWYNQRVNSEITVVKDEHSAAEFVRRTRLTHAIAPNPAATIDAPTHVTADALENYVRAHGRVIATSGNETLIALDDDHVWPRELWRLDPVQPGTPISVRQVITASAPVNGGVPVLVEIQGLCEEGRSIPRIDLFWSGKGEPLGNSARVEACLLQPERGKGTFAMRVRMQVPDDADAMSIRLAGMTETPTRLTAARIRTLADAP